MRQQRKKKRMRLVRMTAAAVFGQSDLLWQEGMSNWCSMLWTAATVADDTVAVVAVAVVADCGDY